MHLIGASVPHKKKGGFGIRPPLVGIRRLEAVIHLEFDRVRGDAEESHLFHLERDVRVDHVIGEDAAPRQEFAILIEMSQRFVE